MLNVTESAASHLAQILSSAPDEAVIRFVPVPTGLTMEVAPPEPGDTTIEHADRTVLAFDAAVNEALAEKTLDLQTTANGPQLTLR